MSDAALNDAFNAALAASITEEVFYEDGKIHNVRTQDVERIVAHNAHLAENHTRAYYGDAAWRHVGSIPLVVAEVWSKETGTRIGTREFAEVCKKKLMNGDFARLRIKGI